MRSASCSFWRVKLICIWIAMPCAEAIAAWVICPLFELLLREATTAAASAASVASMASFCLETERAM